MTTPAGAPGTDDVPVTDATPREESSRNWMGLSALATGALGLSLIAIPLGHLGLAANKNGTATNRTFALAGTILGYIGLAAAVIIATWYFLLVAPTQSRDTNDVNAQVDASAVGREIALYAIDHGTLPTVAQTSDGYMIENTTVPAALTTDRTLTMAGRSATDWCILLTYSGGGEEAFSYLSGTGLEPGDGCRVVAPEPSASPSPDPSASPGEPEE